VRRVHPHEGNPVLEGSPKLVPRVFGSEAAKRSRRVRSHFRGRIPQQLQHLRRIGGLAEEPDEVDGEGRHFDRGVGEEGSQAGNRLRSDREHGLRRDRPGEAAVDKRVDDRLDRVERPQMSEASRRRHVPVGVGERFHQSRNRSPRSHAAKRVRGACPSPGSAALQQRKLAGDVTAIFEEASDAGEGGAAHLTGVARQYARERA
jgi:hypothetical protein